MTSLIKLVPSGSKESKARKDLLAFGTKSGAQASASSALYHWKDIIYAFAVTSLALCVLILRYTSSSPTFSYALNVSEASQKQQPSQNLLYQRGILVHRLPDGGAGNQIEGLLTDLKVAQQNNFEYVMPFMMIRKNYSYGIPPEDIWNLDKLKKFVPKLHARVPRECDKRFGGKIDIYYMENINPILLKLRSNIRLEQPPNGTIILRKRAFSGRNFTAIREDARRRLIIASAQLQANSMQSHMCISFSGRYSDRGMEREMAPLLKPSRLLSTAAQQWPLKNLALVHLRYHEQACKQLPKGPDPSEFVCIAGRQNGNTQQWVRIERFATKIEHVLKLRKLTNVYLTRSMYMPDRTWHSLEATFKRKGKIRVVKSAAAQYQGEWLNFVERQIATDAKLFIAEEYSSWSDTILSARNESRTDALYLSTIFNQTEANQSAK